MPAPTPLVLPPGLTGLADRGPTWARWVRGLPGVLADLLAEWDLVPHGPLLHGSTAVVVPVRGASSGGGTVPQAALKVAHPDDETEHEGLALQRWGGRGAVRLQRADPHRRALLLDWLPGPDLTDAWDVEACEVVGGLLATLSRPAPAQLRTLASYVARSDAALGALPRDAPLPRRLVEQARSLTRDLLADPGEPRLLHTDLHHANVLADAEGTWHAIDPKPLAGDPHHEPAPLLWNRWEEVVASGDVRGTVRARFHAVVDAAGLDEHRARDWVVVRMVHNALWELEDHPRSPDRDWLTTCVTVAKAVQD